MFRGNLLIFIMSCHIIIMSLTFKTQFPLQIIWRSVMFLYGIKHFIKLSINSLSVVGIFTAEPIGQNDTLGMSNLVYLCIYFFILNINYNEVVVSRRIDNCDYSNSITDLLTVSLKSLFMNRTWSTLFKEQCPPWYSKP